jgi:hypothetical protein
MTRVRGVSGGGAQGNFIAETRAPKTEPKSRAVSVGAVSRLGGAMGEGSDFKPLYQSTKASTPFGATPGNDCRLGGNGRMIMRAGSQSATPQARPMSGGRKII